MTTQQESIDHFKDIFPAGSSILPVVYWQHPYYPEVQSICFYALREGDHPRSLHYITGGYVAPILAHRMDEYHDGAMYLEEGETPTSIIRDLGMVCYQDETAYTELLPIPHLVREVEPELELRQKLQLLTSPINTGILTQKTWKSDDSMLTTIRTLALTLRGGHFEFHDISILSAYALDRAYSFTKKGIAIQGTGFNHALELTKELSHLVWGDDDNFTHFAL